MRNQPRQPIASSDPVTGTAGALSPASLVVLVLLFALPGMAGGSGPLSVESRSGQFIVSGFTILGGPRPLQNATGELRYVRLEPSLLAVSCERVKHGLLQTLGVNDQWRGRIYVRIYPAPAEMEPVQLMSIHHLDGWHYRLDLPEHVESGQLVDALVRVLLLEIANRKAGAQQADLPLWLSKGLAAELRRSTLLNFTVELDTSVVQTGLRKDPLAGPRERLQSQRVLSLDELSWPTEEELTGEKKDLYESCAHLFVHQLLRLERGAACLREFLQILPERLNWQTAFLRAFHDHFPRLVDLDKWWSLNAVHVLGRQTRYTWGSETVLNELNQIVSAPVEVRLQASELPMGTIARLQNILTEWEYEQQDAVLPRALARLRALRTRTPAELAGLVDGYREVLERYLEKRGQSRRRDRGLIAEILKALHELDERRMTLWRQREEAKLQQTAAQ